MMAPEQRSAPSGVLRATIAAALFPGAGYLLLRRFGQGVCTLAAIAAGLSVAILHLVRGLAFFETSLGVFLFPVLLRGLLILHAFSVLDAYLRAVDSTGQRPAQGREAIVLNLLVPGFGYVRTRAWVRAAMAALLLVLILVFAHSGKNPYLDVIYVALQVVTAAAAYQQQQLRARGDGEQSFAALPKASSAQIVVLLAVTAAVVGCGFVLEQALPPTALRGLSLNDLQTSPKTDGLHFTVPRLGLSIIAAGPDWKSRGGPAGFLLAAEHEQGAKLWVGVQQIPPFVRMNRYLARVEQWVTQQGLKHERTLERELHGKHAVQMRFSGAIGAGNKVDHWTVVIPAPAQHLAYLVMFSCPQPRCSQLASQLEQTLESVQVP